MTLEERVKALELAVEALKPVNVDLASEYDNPVVRKDPRQWLERGGASYEGRKFSECPPDYLEALAGLFDWQAKKDAESGATYVSKKTGETVATAPFKRKDAARARAWAKANASKPAAKRDDFEPFGDDAPF
jgi:hypothetical protein